jgi:hypothetical protein
MRIENNPEPLNPEPLNPYRKVNPEPVNGYKISILSFLSQQAPGN